MTPPRDRDPRQPPGWLPHPWLSLLLALVWLLLQQSAAPAQLITAAVLGLGLPRWLHGWLGPARRALPRAGRLGVAARLAIVVLWDILRGNLAVARLALTPGVQPRPAWVQLPLALRHPGAIHLLASVVTMTPGTVSCVIDEARWQLLIHVLDGDDPDAVVAEIRQRYEQPIRELFE
jgi:multicomponent K+:H+ antiporter subunit E